MTTKKTTKKSASSKDIERDIIAEALLLGMGLFDIGKEKVKKLAEDISKDRNISKEAARKKADIFIKNVNKNKKQLETYVRKQVKMAMDEVKRKKK